MLPDRDAGAEPAMEGDEVEMRTCTVCGAEFSAGSSVGFAAGGASDPSPQERRCSARCRRIKLGDVDRRLENAISTLLAARARGATICPSEAAKVVSAERWQDLMERARWAGHRMAADDRIVVLQGGRVVGAEARGPVRFGLLH